jgi:ABC-type multidrug transport system ATPase subunit
MEEAEALCDRIGIFVNGEFECVGNPKEIATRYGSTFVFTITTPIEQQEEVRQLALSLSPSAKKVYQLSGTQKFELPVTDVRLI